MSQPVGRRVTLVLCTDDGELLGALSPFEVRSPYWQDVAEVVLAARARHGVEVTILRLLSTETASPREGGPVAYLAQVDRSPAVSLHPWPGDPVVDHPLRQPYARPGGPQADLAWAEEALRGRGMTLAGKPRQVRTWNLSSIWRLPTTGGVAWLKVVPPFLAREAALLRRLDGRVVPPVLAAAGSRVLLGDVPGDDQYSATGAPLLTMAGMLIDLQAAWVDGTPDLLGLGAADWRADALVPRVRGVADRYRHELGPAEQDRLAELVDGLPQRCDDIASCGLPDTLVHGDFHPGNVRGTPGRFVILDWGETAVGQPMMDSLAFCASLPDPDRILAERFWAQRWRSLVPGCHPERAGELLRPVTALRGAVVYQAFLDAIEPDERPYHEPDPLDALRRAVGR